MKKHTNFPDEVYKERGNDWGFLLLVAIGVTFVLIMIAEHSGLTDKFINSI